MAASVVAFVAVAIVVREELYAIEATSNRIPETVIVEVEVVAE